MEMGPAIEAIRKPEAIALKNHQTDCRPRVTSEIEVSRQAPGYSSERREISRGLAGVCSLNTEACGLHVVPNTRSQMGNVMLKLYLPMSVGS